MAVVKFINSKSKRGLKSLHQALDYVDDKDKTMNDIHLIGGIAKNSDDAFMRMNVVKNLWHKNTGRQYIHFVVSPKGDMPDKNLIDVSKNIQSYFKDFGSFYGIHKNTQNNHVHFILNSVAWNGKKYSQSKSEMKKFKNFISDLCEKYEIKVSKAEEIYQWGGYWNNSQAYFTVPSPSYRPHINDEYKPVCWRMGADGNYYPVNPVNPNGKVNMIQEINPKTDKTPMIYLVDEDGYLTPGI